MIRPVLQDDAFLASVNETRGSTAVHLWWLGQSGYLVQWNGRHLLIDPYLSDSLTTKYAATNKPHVRMTERIIDPARLDFIDVTTSSHNHTDHLDGETVIPLMSANPDLTVIVPTANRDFAAERFQCDPLRLTTLNASESLETDGFTFHAVPAAHEQLETDDNGNHRFQGYVIEVGGATIYHSGDTMLFDGMVDWLTKWKIDAAILPINGRDPKRGVAGNLSGAEATRLGSEIGAGVVIPCHYEMFAFNTVSSDGFVLAAKRIGQRVHVMKCGERWRVH
ncbi:MAG: MBL fold metallo-hydrolase [Candidatus Poribacteria bacterium]|nr:MBL fold metallo-hydrolase [Candidatus Poribacteria bacterium]